MIFIGYITRCIIFLTVFILSFSGYSQFSQIRFEHLDIRDGLSHNRVTSIYQDELGFIWFGTLSGLNRYDGTEIKILQYDEADPYSLNNSNIIWIAEGPGQLIWIKTSYGVYAYDINREKFVEIGEFLTKLQVDSYNLNEIIKDRNGDYWFVVNGVGIKKYISGTDSLYHFDKSFLDVTSIQTDNNGFMSAIHLDGHIDLIHVETLQVLKSFDYPSHLKGTQGLTSFIDKDGHYWFYSSTSPFGACYFKPGEKKYRILDKKNFGSNLVSGIIQDQAGQIVIGVDHGGLAILSKRDWNIQVLKNNPADPKSLSHNTVISLYQDNTGLIWVGTHKGGINYYSPKSISFKFFKQTGNVSPNENDILQVVEGENGGLWLGTDGGGLVHFDRPTGKFKKYTHDITDPKSISSNIIVSMANAADGGLWVGTYLGGINYFDGKTFTRHIHDPEDENSPSDNSIWKLYMDSKEQLWVGTLKAGVDVYDRNFRKVHSYNQSNYSIQSDYITSFHEDKDGNMWIGTGYGLAVFDPGTNTFEHILKEEGNPNSLSNNSTTTIYCDSKNNVWVGTMHGLNKYDKKTGLFTVYTKKEGLPENIIVSIMEDDEGSMWFGTYKGLSKLSFKKGEPVFENFDISDGLQGEMFNERSVLKTRDGELVFGGKNGINLFHPEDIKDIRKEVKLVFLEFYIANKLIKPGEEYNGRKWFEYGINNTSSLDLKHFENSFTIEFTALSFYQQENAVYKYRLAGFDEDWIIRSNIHRANYTNLDPGNYRFEVMTADQNTQWTNDPMAIDINIAAPFWKTPVAYVLYGLAVLGILLFTRRSIIQKERFRAKVAQERLEAERLHELDLMKIKFFTNVSHEFRTPLTLILTPIERLLKHSRESEHINEFQLIFRNAKRLLTLVNQLLDFRKIETNQHKLSLSGGDLVEYIKGTVDSFSDLSKDRHIKLSFHSSLSEFLTLFDKDKMEKVMFNLLSNAHKFTHAGGSISVELREISNHDDIHTLEIRVKDTGIGIPPNRHEDIFKRFFQVDSGQPLNLNHGSGIGLSITKEFVEMHNGKIWVESEVDKGSTFIFQFPVKEIEGDSNRERLPDEEPVDAAMFASRPSILLAEDNDDFRFYLKDNLKQVYNIQEAQNGKAAWKKIVANPPDLVVTDLMMPGLTGIELCKKVKKDPRTAHIPVILLTAHYSDDQKIEGYEAGAIEYITKPFNFEILVSSINSAIQLQKFIHAAENRVDVKPSEISITPLDEQFMGNAFKIVEENISNADFSVQELSRELAVSRGQLYKKILELTGMTPIEFIRAIRLKRAAALLEKSQLTVAEVAYKVGFNNPKYFAKYFKAEYNVLPSKYTNKSSPIVKDDE